MQKTSARMPASVLSAMVLILLTIATSRPASGQVANTVTEPQYVGTFQALGQDGALTPLESQKFATEIKSHNHFVSATATAEQTVVGAASPVRLKADVHFIVRLQPGTESIDPESYVSLKPFTVDKTKRSLLLNSTKAHITGNVNSATGVDTSIKVTFRKYGQFSLEIIPAQPLAPGEYALSRYNGALGVFCFGVDK